MLSRNLILLFTLLTASNEIGASYEGPSTWECIKFLVENLGDRGCHGKIDTINCLEFVSACGWPRVNDNYYKNAKNWIIGAIVALVLAMLTFIFGCIILLCACRRN